MKTRIIKREHPGFDDNFVVQQRYLFFWIDTSFHTSLEAARRGEQLLRKIYGQSTKETVVE